MTSTPAADSKPSVLHLNWKDDVHLSVTPRDQDRFAIRLRTAIEVLRLHAGEYESFDEQAKLLMKRLALWVNDHAEIVTAIMTLAPGGGLQLVIATSHCNLSPEFEDEVSELERSIAQDPDLHRINLEVFCCQGAEQEQIWPYIDSRFAVETRIQEPPPKGKA